MKARTQFAVVDLIFNYFLFTPLVLLFWYGTYVLIDQFIFSRLESRIVAAVVTLSIGLGVEFIVTYWQDAFLSRGRYHSSGLPFIAYSRSYNYVLAVANICHYRAVQEFYDVFMASEDGEPGGLMPALQTAVTSIVLLWSMRAGRNITAIPFAVSVDSDPEGWFSAPTLYQCHPTKRVRHLLDTVVTVGVVWTLGPLHWITLGYVFDAVIFPDNYEYATIVSCVAGYVGVTVFSLLQESVKQTSQRYERDNRFAVMTLVEDVYIFAATAAVILTWKGVGMAVDTMARQFPVHCADCDITGLCANVASFLLLSLCYVTGSLVGKGAEMDGSSASGAGVVFPTAYFGHFFEDYIREKDHEPRQQTTTTTFDKKIQ